MKPNKELDKLVEKGLIFDMTNDEYHGCKGTFSSSQMKDLLADPEVFHKKYITGEVERLSIPAFDIGTYFHTAILEPELLDKECAVFTEGTRRGKKWETFKEEHAGKAIITKNELTKAETLINAVKGSSIANAILDGGMAEASLFVKILVQHGEIYSKGCKLDPYKGWIHCEQGPDEELSVVLYLKVRADYLNEEGYIADLKSTNGNCKDAHAIQGKVASYQYDLSAAFYLDLFTIGTGVCYETFYWIFASKDVGNTKTYKMSDTYGAIGRRKWMKAIVELAQCMERDWEFGDALGVLEPQFFEKEWLNVNEEDLL
jgi:hypothetical protein